MGWLLTVPTRAEALTHAAPKPQQHMAGSLSETLVEPYARHFNNRYRALQRPDRAQPPEHHCGALIQPPALRHSQPACASGRALEHFRLSAIMVGQKAPQTNRINYLVKRLGSGTFRAGSRPGEARCAHSPHSRGLLGERRVQCPRMGRLP